MAKKRKRRIVAGATNAADEGGGLSRREFLAGLAATTGVLALGGCGDDDPADPGGVDVAGTLPDPELSGIEHIVVVMMENRSFDHMLGWVPNADGRQDGLAFVDKNGGTQSTFALAPDFQNCHFHDPDHSYAGGRLQLNGGASDGWLQARTNDLFPIGYYRQDDLSFYGAAVPAWTTFDRYFCSILGPTFPNRLYMHTGQTDRLTNTLNPVRFPSIWDRLLDRGLSGRYYFSDGPVTILLGNRTAARINKQLPRFFEDAASGNLPNVAYIDPAFGGAGQGLSNDDHPVADIRNGQAFLSRIYDAIIASPNWENTVLIVNYDEWGGFYDHVAPPMAPLTEQDPIIGNDGRLGFRVPCLMMSPLARRGFVSHQQYDHTSILRFIEWRWGLEPLTVRDQTANNIGEALDFRRGKNLSAPSFAVPQGPFGVNCSAAITEARSELAGLREAARRQHLLDD